MSRRMPYAIGLWLLLPLAVQAASKSFEVTVAAGEYDRHREPVRVLLEVPAAFRDARTATLKDAAGKALPAQLTAPCLLDRTKAADGMTLRELHFILPSLKAGATLTMQATLSTESPAAVEGYSWKDQPGEYTDLMFGTRPVLRYVYQALDDSTKQKREQTYKVYHHLFDPTGGRLVTKGPGGLDTHHRGLFFGFNRITFDDGKKADTWQCLGDSYQAHERFLAAEQGPVLGRHRVEVGWHGAGKELFAREERELTAYDVPGGTLVEFASRLHGVVPGSSVTLDGSDQHHAGFHFRADNEVASKTQKQTFFLRPDGKGQPNETRNWDVKTKKGPVNLPWDAMSFVLGGQRYTAGYLDRPGNPKESRCSERAYGRFGSSFIYELTPEKPLEVAYRIWLQRGEMQVDDMAALSHGFITPVSARVK